MEVVAVANPYDISGQDGVSMTYVMALATVMFDQESYICLPSGSGVCTPPPPVFWISSAWLSVIEMYLMYNLYLSSAAQVPHTLRILV